VGLGADLDVAGKIKIPSHPCRELNPSHSRMIKSGSFIGFTFITIFNVYKEINLEKGSCLFLAMWGSNHIQVEMHKISYFK
jgi:hypothetical protein